MKSELIELASYNTRYLWIVTDRSAAGVGGDKRALALMLRDGTGEVGGDKVRVGSVRVIVLIVLGNDRDGVLVIWIVLMAVNGVLNIKPLINERVAD